MRGNLPLMDAPQNILKRNKAWAASRLKDDPDYFKRLVEQQEPDVLWIGCSDSRVAANVITATEPGELFVHRNIANLVVPTDINVLSVLEYAVTKLEVKHVIVCGHYGCGGVQAAVGQQNLGLINNWLRNIEDVYRLHRDELTAINDEKQRIDRLVEKNVEEQVLNLAKTSIIQSSWQHRKLPVLHGWVYGLETGLLRSLCTMEDSSALDHVNRYENL